MNNPQDQWWMPGGGLYSDLPTFPYDEGSDYQTEQNLPNPPDWEALQESLLNMLPHNLRNMDDQNITPRQFSPQELPDMLFRYFGPNNVDPYKADYDRDPLLVNDTEGDLSNKELMNLFRDKQKEDPRGDNVLGLGDMRRLPGPPPKLPWPLEDILKFKESIFGEQFSEMQKRVDKRREGEERQKQLKKDIELKKQQDMLNESKDIILRMRKPTDYQDEPDPYLNPYKENDPTINSRDLFFKTPPAQNLPENYPRVVQEPERQTGVIEAWKAGTLFPKPAPWWKRVMGA